MIKLPLRKISQRLTLFYSLLFFLALVLVTTATIFSFKYYIKNTSEQQIVLINKAIVNNMSLIDDIKKFELKNISQTTDNIDLNVIYQNNIIYDSGEQYNLGKLNKKYNTVLQTNYKGTEIMVYNSLAVLKDGRKIELQIIKDMDKDYDYLDALIATTLTLDAIAIIISIISGYLISKRALSPIDKIRKQASEISVTDLNTRINIEGPDDELKRLADTFNDLISRIQISYEKQNQFTMDASHELATPIAVIKGYIDIIDRWGKHDKNVLDEGIGSIKIELTNITKLLDRLLFIAQNEEKSLKLEKTKFNIGELISEVIKESKMIDQSFNIYCEKITDIEMLGDRSLIKQILRALIDNSMKYSKDNKDIEISYIRKSDKVVISVEDNGIGISEDDTKHLFERFYRADKARSRDIGGYGLGLAIVKLIIELHKGTIEVNSKLESGTKIDITLPIN